MPYHILKISASRLVLPASSAPCQGDAHLAVANQLPSLATPRVIYGGSCLTRPPFDAPSQMRTSYPLLILCQLLITCVSNPSFGIVRSRPCSTFSASHVIISLCYTPGHCRLLPRPS